MKTFNKFKFIIIFVCLLFASGVYAADIIQHSMTAGEISPRLGARSDLAKYQNGLDTLTNAIVLPHGGVERRPGFKYIASVKTAADTVRLIPFEFSTTQTYIIEAGNNYFRFYMDGGQILSGASPYEISTPYRDDDVSDLKFVQSADTLYITHPYYSPRKLTRTGHTAWTLTEITFTNSTTDAIEGVTQADPAVVTCTGHVFDTGDKITITDVAGMTQLNNGTYLIVKIDADTFSLQDIDGNDIDSTGYDAYTSGGTVTLFGRPSDWSFATDSIEGATAADPVVITCTGHGLASTDQIIISGVVGMTELNGNLYNITRIDADTFSLQDATTDTDIDGSGYTAYSSGGTVDIIGQPACVTLFEERSIWAGVPAYPQTIYMSTAGDFEDMTTGTDADDAIVYTISSDQVNSVRWMVSGKKLLMGTNGGEWWASGAGIDEPIIPTGITIRRETTYGSENIQPLNIGNNVIFVQRPGKILRQWGYVFEDDAYKGTDLSVFSEHLTKNYSITDIAYQQTPNSIIWAVRSDGDLLSLTYMPEHEVYGWARHTTGSTTNPDDFESIAVIEGDAFSELWAVVKRNVNGKTVRYVEQLQSNEWAFEFSNTVTTSDAVPAVETDSDTVLLIHSNTTNGSTTFTDSSPLSWSPIAGGDAQHSTAQKKFGTSSMKFDGTGDSLQIATTIEDSDDKFCISKSADNFTVDFWILPANTVASTFIMGVWCASCSSKSWAVYRVHATNTITFKYSTDGSAETDIAGSLPMSYSAWTHVRIVRSGEYIRLFINGNLDTEHDAGSDTFHDPNHADIKMAIGYYANASAVFDGYIDELAIIKGEALSTGEFIPPSQAYGSSAVAAVEATETATTPEEAFFVDSGLTYNDTDTITNATQASPIVITAASHGLVSNDEVYIQGVVGMTELNGNTYTVTYIGANSFSLYGTDGTDYMPYVSGGTAEKLATTITGLSHLEGETVAILADGSPQSEQTVQGGAITLSSAASYVVAGRPYTTTVKTLRPDFGELDSVFAKRKRITNLVLKFFQTTGAEAGPDADNMDDVSFDTESNPRGSMPEVFTGEKHIRPEGVYDFDGQIIVRQSDPAPFTLLSIIKELEAY